MKTLVVPVLLVGLGALCLVSACLGAVAIAPTEVLAVAGHRLGWGSGTFTEAQRLVLETIRWPRLAFGTVAGAVLALGGAVLQGLFRNPLADPGLLGISGGAALAAAIAIALNVGPLPLWAFVGAAITGLLVWLLSLRRDGIDTASLLLAGIALNALTGAGYGLIIALVRDAALRDITFWSLGSLGGVTWSSLLQALPGLALPLVLAPFLARPLNALALGERDAANLGVPVQAVKIAALVLTAGGVGAAVAFVGIIGFVGLVAPHLARMLVGSDHRVLLPAAACLGALLLVVADLAARMVIIPAELPVGVVTALVGAPVFLVLWALSRPGARR